MNREIVIWRQRIDSLIIGERQRWNDVWITRVSQRGYRVTIRRQRVKLPLVLNKALVDIQIAIAETIVDKLHCRRCKKCGDTITPENAVTTYQGYTRNICKPCCRAEEALQARRRWRQKTQPTVCKICAQPLTDENRMEATRGDYHYTFAYCRTCWRLYMTPRNRQLKRTG